MQVDLVPAQAHQLGQAQTVAVGYQDQRGIAGPWRPTPAAAVMSAATSLSDRYSRLRYAMFARRRGTFRFSMVGRSPPYGAEAAWVHMAKLKLSIYGTF